jgi:O-acetyl-ADP-ribose deacetylase (regulator of RNase III)
VDGINYVIGDATEPVGDGPKLVAHICNDQGGWGRGFVMALSGKDEQPERLYRKMAVERPLELGSVQMCLFGPQADGSPVFVANMVAQHGYMSLANPVPLDYKALRECLDVVGQEAADIGASVHMPRIGCGLGGGSWDTVEEAILAILVDVYKVDVTVYDLA